MGGDPLDAYLGELPPDARARASADPDLATALADALARARAAWPEIGIDPTSFARHLGTKAAHGGPAALIVEDLYLACAAAQGDAAAIRVLERDVFRGIAGVLVHRGIGRDTVEEVVQDLRAHLLVARDGRPGRIADYGGRGALRSWIVVSAVRMGQRARHNEGRAAALPLVSIADPGPRDVVDELGRREVKPQLEQACEQALVDLPARERALLRLQLVDGASIDQIGRIYGVHRATAARWLARARALVLETTTQRLAAMLGVPPEVAASIAELARSELDVSVVRLLQTLPG